MWMDLLCRLGKVFVNVAAPALDGLGLLKNELVGLEAEILARQLLE